MQHKKLTGIILGIQPYCEFDRIIILLSEQSGLVRVIAKGVRRIKSRRSFYLDLFNHVQVELEENGQGLSARKYLREISSIELFPDLKKNGASFAASCLIASFLLRLLPHDIPQKQIFFLTLNTLKILGHNKNTKQIILTYFLKIMRNLGYIPNNIQKTNAKRILTKTLINLDPQFILNARRTLEIFSNPESKKSN